MAQRTDTDIANYALDLLGEPPMGDIGAPDGPVERTIARLYPAAKVEVLSLYWWSSQRRTQTLARLVNETDPEYGSLYPLPDNCVLVWTANGVEDGWLKINGQAGGRLAGNFGDTVSVVYGADLGPEALPEVLALLIGARLADLASSSNAIELPQRKLDRIAKIVDQREARALDVVGSEGGSEDGAFHSRYIDALNGVDPARGGV